MALERGFTDLIRLLLSNGTDPNMVDYDGRTALALTQEKGFHGIAQLIRDHGGKIIKNDQNRNESDSNLGNNDPSLME